MEGIIRHLDDLGRIVIPKEIRKNLGLNENSRLEIMQENKTIVLKIPENKICKCGRALEENSNYCPNCGKKIN